MATTWSEFDREAAAVEALEHAMDLFDAGRSLALVVSVGHAGAQYFSDRVRPAKEDKSAKFELVEMMKEVIGPSFNERWFLERAHGVPNALKHFGRNDPSPVVHISRESAAFGLLCALADCRKATGRVSEKMEAWRLKQVEQATRSMATSPEREASAKRLVAVATARAEAWKAPTAQPADDAADWSLTARRASNDARLTHPLLLWERRPANGLIAVIQPWSEAPPETYGLGSRRSQ